MLKSYVGQHVVPAVLHQYSITLSAIKNQQESFMVQGDISVLSDLLTAHREQLKRLHSNNRSLVEFYNKFAAAKAVS